MFEGVNLQIVIAIVASLAGFAAFVSFLVNALKTFGVVKDGDANKWVAGLNLIGVIAVYATLIIFPKFDFSHIDSMLLEIAAVGSFLLSEILMIFGSKLTHLAVRGLPLIGKSYSFDRGE